MACGPPRDEYLWVTFERVVVLLSRDREGAEVLCRSRDF
jgi:hypothetical protein